MVKGSLEILQELIRNPSQDKEDEAVAAEVLVNDYYSFQKPSQQKEPPIFQSIRI